MLQIADLSFGVQSATLQAFVDDSSLHWGFHVQAAPGQGAYSDWRPVLSSDAFAVTAQGELTSWTTLAPRETRWSEARDTDEIPSAFLYVFEHTPLYQCEMALRPGGSTVHLGLQGQCDVHYDERYGAGLALQLEVDVSLVVLCGRRSEDASRRCVEPYLDPRELAFQQDENGVTTLRSKELV